MELFLWLDLINEKTFRVYRELRKHPAWLTDSVIKLDYNYLPWPRKDGNLLW